MKSGQMTRACNRRTERIITLPAGSPKIIVLCGSTKFFNTFAEMQNRLTLDGYIVLTVGSTTQSDDDLFASMDPAERRLLKAKLDTLHLAKIWLADNILVLNVGGYIGESTEREILYATSLDKSVRWLEPPSQELLWQLGVEVGGRDD